MSELSNVTTVQELVEYLSEFLENVPTQDYVDQELDKRVSRDDLSNILHKLVTKVDFNQVMAAKASKSDLTLAVATKADQNEVTTGIARKANLSSLYTLQAKLNKIFPFKTVETISELAALIGEDLNKVILVVDASADPTLSVDSKGAFYAYSKTRKVWDKLSEVKFNAETISWNAILGKPTSSAAEIDTVVATVIEKLTYFKKLHELINAMHIHSSSLSEIDNAVASRHSHPTLTEVFNVRDTDCVTIVREGELVNVKLSTLKEYFKS